eukprot:156785_1
MAAYLILIGCFCTFCVKCHLLNIPTELQHCIFTNYLNVNDQIKCISTLNTKTYKHFIKAHGNEIQHVKQLNFWFYCGISSLHQAEIRQMTQELQLSELYNYYLPQMLTHLFYRWKKAIPMKLSGKRIITASLDSMSLHSLDIHEFNCITGLDDEMKLLLLSSRTLINYFIPTYYTNTDNNKSVNLGNIKIHNSETTTKFMYFENYPWLRSLMIGQTVPRGPEWLLYMTYLYQFYFSYFDSNLHSIFHLDGTRKKKLLILINEYGFISW